MVTGQPISFPLSLSLVLRLVRPTIGEPGDGKDVTIEWYTHDHPANTVIGRRMSSEQGTSRY